MDSRGVERVRDEFWVSSWGQQVMLNQSCTIPTLLWCFLGRAGPSCAVPSQTGRGERGLLRRVQTCWERWPAPGLLAPAGWAWRVAPFPLARSRALPTLSCLPRLDTAPWKQRKQRNIRTQWMQFWNFENPPAADLFPSKWTLWLICNHHLCARNQRQWVRTHNCRVLKKKNHVLESKFVVLCPFWERCIAMRSKRNPDFCRPPKQITKKEERTGKAIEIDFPLSKWKQSSLQHIYPCKVPAATWSGQKQGLRC